jgi:hypothetical protein
MALLCEQAVSYLVNHPNKKGKHRQGHTQDLTQANVEYSLSHNDGVETMLALKVIQTIKLGVPSQRLYGFRLIALSPYSAPYPAPYS